MHHNKRICKLESLAKNSCMGSEKDGRKQEISR